jgi:hypothetical protein
VHLIYHLHLNFSLLDSFNREFLDQYLPCFYFQIVPNVKLPEPWLVHFTIGSHFNFALQDFYLIK